jgi:hypothetical protein
MFTIESLVAYGTPGLLMLSELAGMQLQTPKLSALNGTSKPLLLRIKP